MLRRGIWKSAIIIFVAGGLISCGDSGTNTEPSDPPQVPDLQQYQPDTEFFSNAKIQKELAEEFQGYDTAVQLVQSVVTPLFSTNEAYLSFFQQARQTEPEYNDGVWEWTYSYSQNGQSADFVLTAEVNESTGDISWELTVTTSGTDGPDFEDYRFMSGTSTADGSEGSWSVYPYESGGSSEPVITFTWTAQDENNYTATYNIESPTSSETFSISYEKASPEHTLDLEASSGEFDFVIFWNSETNEGYIERQGDKICWDTNYETVPCS